MKDTHSKESPEGVSPPARIKPEPAAKGISSIQGKNKTTSDSNQLHWTSQDGTAYHSICEQEVQDQIEDVDKGIEVNNNLPVTVPGKDGYQKTGYIDTHIEDNGHNSIIDYKTNDMSNWSVQDATSFGDKHGKQVAEYVNSQDAPPNSKGYILSLGKVSSSPEVMNAYTEAIGKHKVQTVFVGGDGSPNDVVKAVRTCMKKTRNSK